MWAAGKNVCSEGCSTLDGHVLTTAQFKERDLSSERTGEGLGVADETSRCERKVVANLEQLLNALVSNEVTHGGSMVRSDNDSTVECDSYCTGSSLQYTILCFHDITNSPPHMNRGVSSLP